MAYEKKKDSSALITTVNESILAVRASFLRVLVEPKMNFDREAEFAMQILSKNSYSLGIAARNAQSLSDAITNVGAIGLSLNPALKLAYLVPRKNAICLDISYQGLIELAVSCEAIQYAQAIIVRQNDMFKRRGLDKEPLHEYEEFASAEARGPVVGVYVCAKLPNGDWITTTMTIEEVNEIRDRSESWKAFADPDSNVQQSPWDSDFSEMAKKTCIKRASKSWPKTDRLDKAIHYLNTDGGQGVVDINAKPEQAHHGIDVTALLAEGYKTKSDKAALAFWNKHKASLRSVPADYNRFKDCIGLHRQKLQEGNSPRSAADDPNIIDAELRDVTPPAEQGQSNKTIIPNGMDELYADLYGAAEGGLEDFEIVWTSISKSSKDKLIASGAYEALLTLAKGGKQ